MASIWLANKYAFKSVIAVEPDPTNAALVRENLERNGINCQVLEAAIGPKEGTAGFHFSELSNRGRLSEDGSPVLIQVAQAQGFRYIPAHSFAADNLTCFTRT
jgi:FkbM family methyltransferase